MNKKSLMRTVCAVCAAVISLSSFGAVYADFEEKDGKTYYYDEDGNKERGLVEIDGDTYYFDSKGVMQTGWVTLKRKYKAYFRSDGTMVKGTARIKGKSYFFDEETGYMQTGNVIVNGTVRKYDSKGVYVKTYKNVLVKVNKKLYYADKSGKVTYGLQKIGSNYYYFGSKGYAVSTEVEEDGYLYVLDKDDGLVSREKIVAENTASDKNSKKESASSQAVRVFSYQDAGTGMKSFVAKNEDDGTFTFSGVIKNYSCHNGCTLSVTMLLYDADGKLMKEIDILSSERLRNIGDEVEFKGTWYTDIPVASVKFKISRKGS